MAPLLVFISLLFNNPLTLTFNNFELIAQSDESVEHFIGVENYPEIDSFELSTMGHSILNKNTESA